MLNADPHIQEGYYVDLRSAARKTPIVFTDHQSRNPLDGFEQNSLNGDLLHMLCGEDKIVPESLAHYARGARTFRLAAMPAAEVQTWMACGFAGGITPWYHHISGGTEDRRKFFGAEALMNWHEANETYLYNRTNLANVALVWSQQNADFYGREKRTKRAALPWRGFTAALRDSRTSFIPLHIDELPAQADRFRLLILPDVAAMSDEQISSVCDFIRRGGSIVFTGQSALLDQDGEPRKHLSPLWELLKLKKPDPAVKKDRPLYPEVGNSAGEWELFSRHSYLALNQTRHEILSGFEETDIISFGGTLTPAASDGMLLPVGGIVPPFPAYPPEFTVIPEADWTETPIFAGELPWVGRAVYFAADPDRLYAAHRLPDHGQLLANAIRWALDSEQPITVTGAGMLLVILYAQGNRRIVHIVNLSGNDGLPGLLTEHLPVHEIEVTLPAKTVQHVRRLVAGDELPIRFENGRLHVTLDRISLHEVLVIE